ncbi:MAG: GNAT family N-acetyltransferase [Pseudomonadota bacterium]
MKKLFLPEKIKGTRILLKKNVMEQVEEIFKCIESNRSRLREFMHWVDTTTKLEDEIKFIKTSEMFFGKPMRSYGIFYDGKYIGNISAHNIDLEKDMCEFGYWIDGKYEGKGFMSEAISVLENALRSNGFKRVELAIERPNVRSLKVAEKNGYKYETTVNRRKYEKDLELLVFVKYL